MDLRGTLSQEERGIMEGHVVVTEKLLSQINFSAALTGPRRCLRAPRQPEADGGVNWLNGDGRILHFSDEKCHFLYWQTDGKRGIICSAIPKNGTGRPTGSC